MILNPKHLAAALALSGLPLFAEPEYSVRDVPVPEGIVTEAGGLATWPDGTLVFSTRRGDIWTIRDGRWNLFASGLLEPMGLWAEKVGEVFVSDSHELTRITDTDGDLSADRYETLTAAWEIPGGTTDFVYGLCRDKAGNFFGTMHTTHDPWSKKSKIPGKGNSANNFGGPMGAPVIGRGWSYRVAPDGELTWWSSGLRAPNGIAFNADGDLFATDNQGDWVGTSAMHHIVQGDFHGHPSSYHWDPRRTTDLDVPLEELAVKLDGIRKPPAVLFPHGILGNSPSQPVLAPADGAFGPFAGQFFVGDNVAPLLSRVYLEKIDGEYQGACFPFIREQGLKKALCRMVFSPEGRLIVSFGCRGWGPATTGLQEVAWSGETPFEMRTINLLADGFRITFTKPLAELDLARAISVSSYRYKYHHQYGSPQVDVKPQPCDTITLSQDRKVMTLKISLLEARKIYEFKLNGVKSADGGGLGNSEAYYTLNRLAKDKAQAGAWPIIPLCMDTHDSGKRSLKEQAQLFRNLGYDGCGHLCQDLGYGNLTYPPDTTLEQRSESLAAEGLRVVQAFGRIDLNRENPIDLDRIREMMPTLAANRSQLAFLLLGDRKADLDGKAVSLLGAIADIARPHGVPIVIYPHTGDYVETLAEALRIAKKINRPEELGVMFTFNHWKACDPNRDLRAVLTEAGVWLKAVSINGTNRDGSAILPLDQGDFDVSGILPILRDIGFSGPIDVFCWSIGGDAAQHLESSITQVKEWLSPVNLRLENGICSFETSALRGQIGDGRFIGPNRVIHKPEGSPVSGANGLLSLYRVFTRDHRYGPAAYGWKERGISIDAGSVVMDWPATEERPFALSARYSFPQPDTVDLQVTVRAVGELVDFEVQVSSYFDESFPNAEVQVGDGKIANSPKELGIWHAFPRDAHATAIIGDGRWRHGPSPVDFVMREKFSEPVSSRRSADGIEARLESPPGECFAIYTAHDGEAHHSNYHALFGRTIPAGETRKANVRLTVAK